MKKRVKPEVETSPVVILVRAVFAELGHDVHQVDPHTLFGFITVLSGGLCSVEAIVSESNGTPVVAIELVLTSRFEEGEREAVNTTVTEVNKSLGHNVEEARWMRLLTTSGTGSGTFCVEAVAMVKPGQGETLTPELCQKKLDSVLRAMSTFEILRKLK